MNFSIPSSVESLENIKNHIVRTPLLFSERLSNEINSNISLKLENLQKTGAFKARGALNKILSIKILEEWPLSTRSYNALKDNGIITVQDLIECSENRLLTVRNFGRKGIEEVKNI